MGTTNMLDQLNISDCPLPPLPSTAPPPQPGKFMSVLGRIAGVATNVLFPGVGGLAGTMLRGALGMGSDPTQYLLLQQKMQAEARAYEAVSAVLKAKHDSAMDCLRNIAH